MKYLITILLALNVAHADSVGGKCSGQASVHISLANVTGSQSNPNDHFNFTLHFDEYYSPLGQWGNKTKEWRTTCINGKCQQQMIEPFVAQGAGYGIAWDYENDIKTSLHVGTNTISYQLYNPQYGCNFTANATIVMNP